jgi:hypothetical protein
MKARFHSLLTIALFAMTSAADQPFVMDAAGDGYNFTFDFSSYEELSKDSLGRTAGTDYEGRVLSLISIPGCTYSGDVGYPQIPTYYFSIAVRSPNQLPSISVTENAVTTVTLANDLLPVQKPWLKSQMASERSFTINNAYYQRSSKGENVIASIVESSTMRGVPFVKFKITPASYSPLTRKMTIVTSFTLHVKTPADQKISGPDSKTFESLLRYELVNYDHLVGENGGAGKGAEGYLIIAGSKWESSASLKEFVEFRKQRFNVTLVSTSTTGTSSSAIKTYIKGLNPRPAYILLIGDIDAIPADKLSGASDLNYGNLEGDIKQEIFVGRFSVSSEDHLKNIVKKTIYMEKNLGTLAKHNLYIGSVDAGQGAVAEGTHNYVDDKYLKPNGYTNKKLYYNSDKSLQKSNLTTEMNNNPIFCLYSGHGLPGSWMVTNSWVFSSNDYKSVQNTKSYPFTYNHCCNTGVFDESECYSEAQVRAVNGAAAVISASISTDWTPDDDLEKAIFDAIYNKTNPQTTLAASLNAGKLKVSRMNKEYWEAYNILGDPALSVIPINTSPYIAVSDPDSGAKIETGTIKNVTWSDNINGNVKIDIYEGSALKSTLAASVASNGSYSWNVPADFATSDNYKIRITSIDSSALFGETKKFSVIKEYFAPIPFSENFDKLDSASETLSFKWEQVAAADDLNWTVFKGPTPTRITGKDTTGAKTDHSGSGKYLYVESSSPNFPSKAASILTPKFNLKNVENPVLTFWIHMLCKRASGMGSLDIDAQVDGVWKEKIFTISGSQGDEWIKKTVDLTLYKGERVLFRIKGTTGSNQFSDICLDDFSIEGKVAALPLAEQLKNSTIALNSRTNTISFTIPTAEQISIALFTAQGRYVTSLASGSFKAGAYSIPVARNNGPALSKGVYICKIQTSSLNKAFSLILR